MTMTETRPRPAAPAGRGAQPDDPRQWHGHPHVWAWHAAMGSLSLTFIEDRCKEAADQNAPAGAVYKTSAKDPVTPNTWITVDQLAVDDRRRVRDYGNALLNWERDLADLSQPAGATPAPHVPPAPDPTRSTHGRGVNLFRKPSNPTP